MRFLLDECLSTRLTPILARAGHDVTHVTDIGLGGHPDQDVLDAARTDRRVLLSADTDFGELLARQDTACPAWSCSARTTAWSIHSGCWAGGEA